MILAVEFATDEQLTKEFALNVSKGGVFVFSTQEPVLNSTVHLAIALPDGQTLRTRARAVRVDEAEGGFAVGLDFEAEASADFKQKLAEYLDTRKSG